MKPKYCEETAKKVKDLVIAEFKCNKFDVIGAIDRLEKKIAVFILHKLYGFEKELVGYAFRMSSLYVPTAASEIEDMYIVDFNLRNKICSILNIMNYESKVDISRASNA